MKIVKSRGVFEGITLMLEQRDMLRHCTIENPYTKSDFIGFLELWHWEPKNIEQQVFPSSYALKSTEEAHVCEGKASISYGHTRLSNFG